MFVKRFSLGSVVAALALCSVLVPPARADLVKQNGTYNRTVLMTSSTDHITGQAGLILAVKLSKAGGTYSTVTRTVTDQGGGRYAIALLAGDTDTTGALDLQITATGADPSDTHDQVVGFDPADGAALGLSKLSPLTFTSGKVNAFSILDLTQALTTDIGDTVNGGLLGGRSGTFSTQQLTGVVGQSGRTLKIFNASGVLLKTFDLSTSGTRQ